MPRPAYKGRYEKAISTMTPEDQIELFDLSKDSGNSALRHRFVRLQQALWTEHKAKLISRYLYYFVLITKHGVYIDGFAGPQRADQTHSWAAKLVLESEPRWMRHFFLCDAHPHQVAALKMLYEAQPETSGRTVEIVQADFNTYVDMALDTDKIGERTATFCLLDQRTFECDWATVQKIAKRKSKRKIKIFYFVPTGWLARSITALNDTGSKMARWWGNDDWGHLRRMKNYEIAAAFTQRFRNELRYSYVSPWPIYERKGGERIMYYMIHASDHPEAPKLMARAYKFATNRSEPAEQLRFEF